MNWVQTIERRLVETFFAYQERALKQQTDARFTSRIEKRILSAFHHAAKTSTAYRLFLEENRVHPERITTLERFVTEVPILEKDRFFGRFSVDAIFPNIKARDAGRVWTSSGTSGTFAIGFESRGAAPNALALDFLLQLFYRTLTYKTLYINVLPDGWPIPARYMHYANVGTRTDAAIHLMKELSTVYDQFIIGGEPLLLKKLVEHAVEAGLDFSNLRLHLILGGDYVAASLKQYLLSVINPETNPSSLSHTNSVMSELGMSEFGVGMFFETEATAAIRIAAADHTDLKQMLSKDLGFVPQLFQYDPLALFVESRADDAGTHRLVVTNLNLRSELPLIRYDTKDAGWVFPFDMFAASLRDFGLPAFPFRAPFPIVAVIGKRRDILSDLDNRFSAAEGMELLFLKPEIASRISGYLKLRSATEHQSAGARIQLKEGIRPKDLPTADAAFVVQQFEAKGIRASFERFDAFPDGLGLRYDRKFNYRE